MKFLKKNPEKPLPTDPLFLELLAKYKQNTMLDWIRLYNAYMAVQYIVKNKIPGDIVECGVYKGGCIGLMAETLLRLGERKRRVYLYDTFQGMPPPDDVDKKIRGGMPAKSIYDAADSWCKGDLNHVESVMATTNYPEENIKFIVGDVLETLKSQIPDQISLLRLDTDWYASTKLELEVLYPLLSSGGVLIIDDYGAWEGSRKATDEYFKETSPYFVFDETLTAATAVKL